MSNRKAFLSAVDEASPSSFVHFIELHKSKNDAFDLEELLQALPQKEHERLWNGLKKLCDDVLNMLPLNNDDKPHDDNDNENCQQDEYIETLLQCINGIVVVATCSLSLDKPIVPPSLFETALYLHGMLMHLSDFDKIQNGIAQMCGTWFLKELDGKEELVTNTILYLVYRSISNNTVADIKRIWSLRQSLLLLDFEDNTSESLKQMLHQCILHPLYLKHEEGRRFLSFMFGLHPEFSKELHKTIKSHIPTCKTPSLTAYGEVYFRAWRVASGPYLEVLEKHCIQDLMYLAAHAQRNGTQSMAFRLRRVLHYFHQQKKQKGVDETLLRLYQPIIWRALKMQSLLNNVYVFLNMLVKEQALLIFRPHIKALDIDAANHQVRANAVSLFIDAFPLQNQDLTNEEIDALLQKQFDILQELLEDASPVVRATVVHGVAHIAGVYWELIPSHTVKNLISKLVNELAFDASSSSVRVAVFKGLKFLIDCRLSHPLLKSLLVNLRNLIHDNSEKVRVAFLDLLLVIKGMKTIKLWKIVPVEHLLARLEVEVSAPVLRRLVKLLMNSFLPVNGDGNVQVVRCISLWNANCNAARRFYQYAPVFSTVSNIGRFMIALCKCLAQCAQMNSSNAETNQQQVSDSEEENSQNKANKDVDMSSVLEGDSELTQEDTTVIVGLLETVAILWAAIKEQLQKNANESIKSKLFHRFTHTLPLMFATFEDVHARAAVILIAGNLPPSRLPKLSNECMVSLKSMKVNNPALYGPLLNSMTCWDRTGDVLSLIIEWLSASLDTPNTNTNSQLNDDISSDEQSKTSGGHLALDFLTWMTREPTCLAGVRQLPNDLRKIADILKCVMDKLEKTLTMGEKTAAVPLNEDNFCTRAFKTYFHLVIHLQSLVSESSYLLTETEEILKWAKKVLLPQLDRFESVSDDNQSDCHASPKRRKRSWDFNVTNSLVKTILEISSEIALLGLANDEVCDRFSDFMDTLLQRGSKSIGFLNELATLMFQISQSKVFSGSKEGDAADITLKTCVRRVQQKLQPIEEGQSVVCEEGDPDRVGSPLQRGDIS